MSYDLYFYKNKQNKTTEKQIASYLDTKGEKDGQNSWFFENKDAETYFFISKSEVVEKEDGFFEGLKNGVLF